MLSPTRRFLPVLPSLIALPFLATVATAFPPPPPPGSVRILDVGNIHLRVTSQGYLGRIEGPIVPLVTGQWPGASGVEYLTSIQLAVAAKNPEAIDPALVHRVSLGTEWQPPTTAPEDSIRTSYEGIQGGVRDTDDDGDGFRDEEFLDGHDDDFDGQIDEDHAALGSRMLSFVMRDDTPEAVDHPGPEPHVPFGLKCSQRVWAYSMPGFSDFVVIESTIQNVSGHMLDSVFVGWRVNLACGARDGAGDPGLGDLLVGTLPSAILPLVLDASDPRRQHPWDPVLGIPLSPDSALCPRMDILVRGFSVVDADGDGGLATGTSSFLLVDQTLDPTGTRAPMRTGFRSIRFTTAGVPFAMGGLPELDGDAYRVMIGTEGVDPQTGFPIGETSVTPGDQVALCSTGPYLNVGNGNVIRATIAFAVQTGSAATSVTYGADRALFDTGQIGARELFRRHPALENGFRLETVHLGDNVPAPGVLAPDQHGRETPVVAPIGQQFELADCRDEATGTTRVVRPNEPTWFDFDCNYCTGVYNYPGGQGLVHRPWKVPPSLLVDAGDTDPVRTGLARVYPNPSSGLVRAVFEATSTGRLVIAVADAAGRRVRSLADRDVTVGPFVVTWDGRDDRGMRVGAGVYFIRASGAGTLSATRVVLLD